MVVPMIHPRALTWRDHVCELKVRIEGTGRADLALAEELARRAAIAIDNAILFTVIGSCTGIAT